MSSGEEQIFLTSPLTLFPPALADTACRAVLPQRGPPQGSHPHSSAGRSRTQGLGAQAWESDRWSVPFLPLP